MSQNCNGEHIQLFYQPQIIICENLNGPIYNYSTFYFESKPVWRRLTQAPINAPDEPIGTFLVTVQKTLNDPDEKIYCKPVQDDSNEEMDWEPDQNDSVEEMDYEPVQTPPYNDLYEGLRFLINYFCRILNRYLYPTSPL